MISYVQMLISNIVVFPSQIKGFLGVKYNNTKNLKIKIRKREKVVFNFDSDYKLVGFKRAVVPADTTLPRE